MDDINLETTIYETNQEHMPEDGSDIPASEVMDLAVFSEFADDEIPVEEPDTDNGRSFTVEQYAMKYGIPQGWLVKKCRLTTEEDKYGDTYVKVPYFSENGGQFNFRMVYANRENCWKYTSQKKIGMYGEQLLPLIVKTGYVILVDGEVQAQMLWYLKCPALAVAMDVSFTSRHVQMLRGLNVFLYSRDDRWSQEFQTKILTMLKKGHECRGVFGMAHGPNVVDMVKQDGVEQAVARLKDMVRSATEISLEHIEVVYRPGDILPGGLVIPEGWECTDEGISIYDDHRGEKRVVTFMPVIITRRLRMIDSRDEKIEIAFKADGEWRKDIFPRTTIFSARGIIELADRGCAVTSETAKDLVAFLFQLLGHNQSRIPLVESTGVIGWQPGNQKRFIPGCPGGLIWDDSASTHKRSLALRQEGDRDAWIQEMAKHRKNSLFRFILAAGFTAPLLKIIGIRSFMVFLWGDSSVGKTPALKAALSAWGDAVELMVTFFATQVGLERTLAFFRDLPLGIDERQLAKKQGGQRELEQVVYMISSGIGKTRGTKDGGIRDPGTWRTVAIATGEQPIVTSTTQTGAGKRVIELKGSPFQTEKEAAEMHDFTAANFGWAGPEFICRVITVGDDVIRQMYSEMREFVSSVADDRNGAHVAGVSAVALADAILDDLLFREHTAEGEPATDVLSAESWKEAQEMAKDILLRQAGAKEVDINHKALGFICDWLAANTACFANDSNGTKFGFIEGDDVYIIPSILQRELEQSEYSYDKTKHFLADKELIVTTPRSDKKGRDYTVQRWRNGVKGRFIVFHWDKALNAINGTGKDETPAEVEIIPKVGSDFPVENDFKLIPDDMDVPWDM